VDILCETFVIVRGYFNCQKWSFKFVVAEYVLVLILGFVGW